MSALGDFGDRAADVVTVLQHGVAFLDVLERDLVTERYGVERLEPDGLVGLHDPAGQRLVRRDILYHNDADGVGLVVHDKMRRHRSSPIAFLDLEGTLRVAGAAVNAKPWERNRSIRRRVDRRAGA